MDTLGALAAAIVELDEDEALRLTHQVMAEGNTTPLVVLKTCQQAMRIVGERYERGEYALAALILAGEVFKGVYEIVQPEPAEDFAGDPVAVVVLGTVAGDIHDIGKNMFGQALRTFGFTVFDLGVDVRDECFLEAVRLHRPDLLCLSGLISIAFDSMKRVVELMRESSSELGYVPAIVIGGGTIDGDVCGYAGADSWSTDAIEGVRICERLVIERGRSTEEAEAGQ